MLWGRAEREHGDLFFRLEFVDKKVRFFSQQMPIWITWECC